MQAVLGSRILERLRRQWEALSWHVKVNRAYTQAGGVGIT